MNSIEYVRRLLASNVTGYRIAKETGVPESTISKIRNGKRQLEALSVETLYRLKGGAKVFISERVDVLMEAYYQLRMHPKDEKVVMNVIRAFEDIIINEGITRTIVHEICSDDEVVVIGDAILTLSMYGTTHKSLKPRIQEVIDTWYEHDMVSSYSYLIFTDATGNMDDIYLNGVFDSKDALHQACKRLGISWVAQGERFIDAQGEMYVIIRVPTNMISFGTDETYSERLVTDRLVPETDI